LNEGAVFRMEVRGSMPYVMLNFDLMYSEATEGITEDTEFIVVSSKQFKLVQPLDFNSHFLPVTFEKKYFSLINIGVHSMLLSFPWRMKDHEVSG
jgi:hypothetical protein